MQLLLIAVTLLLIFEYAALRWGFDSRDGFRLRTRYQFFPHEPLRRATPPPR